MAASKRIGLYGGTFDPPHMGHIVCAEETRKMLSLDEVWFIPTYQPVFKRDQFVTPANHRLRMVELAIQDNPHFVLSTIETDRGGDTYTIDTLRTLRQEDLEKGVQNEYFFICGADAVLTLPKWKNSRELVELATFVGVGRPGSSSLLGSPEADALKAFTDKVSVIEIDAVDVSSSEVRQNVKDKESIQGMVPELVEEYIMSNKLYTNQFELSEFAYQKTDMADVKSFEDPFCKESYEQMRSLLKKRVKSSRYEHSVSVAKTAKKLAEAYGYDANVARMAGLLHDWDKALSNERLENRIVDYGIPVDQQTIKTSPQVLHGMTAACVLREQFPQFGEEVFQSIYRHTVAAKDMSDLDMIVFCADKLEPLHHVEVYEELAKRIGKMPLKEIFFETYKAGIVHLLNTNRPLGAESVEVWNSYCTHQ